MNKLIFYTYLSLGVLFTAISIYNLVKGAHGNAVIYDPLLALLLFYRVYRMYKTKQDQELM